MNTHYTKSGRTVRQELIRGQRHELLIDEQGFAIDDGLTFHCSPGEGAAETSEAMEALQERSRSFYELVMETTAGVPLERCVVSSGASTHSFRSGDDEHTWSEQQTRAHIAFRHASGAIEIDLDIKEWAASEPHLLAIVAALTAEAPTRPPLEKIALAPFASATLLPEWLRLRAPLQFEQRPRGDTLDGDGTPIASLSFGSGAPWPNRFRPSYRTVPLRLPHDVAITPTVDEHAAEENVVEGVAIIGTMVRLPDLLVFRLLLTNGSDVTLELPVAQLQRSVREVGPPLFWTPRMAGVWGQRIVLGR
jgi:hypothetical protein